MNSVHVERGQLNYKEHGQSVNWDPWEKTLRREVMCRRLTGEGSGEIQWEESEHGCTEQRWKLIHSTVAMGHCPTVQGALELGDPVPHQGKERGPCRSEIAGP